MGGAFGTAVLHLPQSRPGSFLARQKPRFWRAERWKEEAQMWCEWVAQSESYTKANSLKHEPRENML